MNNGAGFTKDELDRIADRASELMRQGKGPMAAVQQAEYEVKAESGDTANYGGGKNAQKFNADRKKCATKTGFDKGRI
jgi:hypothetical protein